MVPVATPRLPLRPGLTRPLASGSAAAEHTPLPARRRSVRCRATPRWPAFSAGSDYGRLLLPYIATARRGVAMRG